MYQKTMHPPLFMPIKGVFTFYCISLLALHKEQQIHLRCTAYLPKEVETESCRRELRAPSLAENTLWRVLHI